MFDPAAFEIWIASLQIPGPWLCTEDVFLFGQTYHNFSWYPYELIGACPVPIDSNGLGWNGFLFSVANGVIPLQWIGTFGPGIYRVVVDVLRDHHYNAPDNWDPWLCFAVPHHCKLVIDCPSDYVTPSYTAALDELGIQYDINRVPPGMPPDPGPPWQYLIQYDVVIWVTGNAHINTILPQDAYNLAQYLDHGGKLLLTGQDIGSDIFQHSPPNDTTMNFYTQYLKSQYVQDNVGIPLATGLQGGFLSNFSHVQITGPGGANYPDFAPDEINPIPNGMPEMRYGYQRTDEESQRSSPGNTFQRTSFPGMDDIIGSGTACIATENLSTNSRVVYFPFAFEGITSDSIRRDMLSAALHWLYGSTTGPEVVHDLVIINQEDNVRLEWSPSVGALSYRIYASQTDPFFTPDSVHLIGAVSQPGFEDIQAKDLFGRRFYLVTAIGSGTPAGGTDEGMFPGNRQALHEWISSQSDITTVTQELERRKIRYIVNSANVRSTEISSSFNHHLATEPDYLRVR